MLLLSMITIAGTHKKKHLQLTLESTAKSTRIGSQLLPGGVFIYNWYALILHLPSILIVTSEIPCFAAVVAAPLLKLWPE